MQGLAHWQEDGFLKGNSAVQSLRNYLGRPPNFIGQHFSARDCYVSTEGRDEASIGEYIQNRGEEDERLDQLTMSHE